MYTHTRTHTHTLKFLLISVITYAIFEVSYKKFATEKDDPAAVANGARVLGYMGVHTLLWLWPPIVIFHFSGLEPFELPPRGEWWPLRKRVGGGEGGGHAPEFFQYVALFSTM